MIRSPIARTLGILLGDPCESGWFHLLGSPNLNIQQRLERVRRLK